MENPRVIETRYPISFRQEDAKELGAQLNHRHSVVLVGMKRVGISSFLRFFLYHKDIPKTYLNESKQHLFIPVDLNDLAEREISPFWTLTLKRIVDAVATSKLPHRTKKEIESLFLDSIQLQDTFLTIDNVRRSLVQIAEHGFLPTIFFIRFDRIKEVITPQFFSNLQGLRDATHQQLAYVFTSSRTLDVLSPHIFSRSSLVLFVKDIFITPVKAKDRIIISATYRENYKMLFPKETEAKLTQLVDGYVQYLQLALIVMHEKKVTQARELEDVLIKDERILLQSEELWESLTPEEQKIVLKVSKREKISVRNRQEGKYLWDTGLVIDNKQPQFFSPLFAAYINTQEEKTKGESVEFSKKEHALFSYLQEHMNDICEREKIVENVWPEVEAFGVSDWAIDRLVARVRSKLKQQKSTYEVQTIKTRGYKLIATS